MSKTPKTIALNGDIVPKICKSATGEMRNNANMARVLVLRGLAVKDMAHAIRNNLSNPADQQMLTEVFDRTMVGLTLDE